MKRDEPLHSSKPWSGVDKPMVMGILNVTPDSFSDGGRLFVNNRLDYSVVLQTAKKMLDDGAAIIDVGGESTRPGAKPISVQQELDRVVSVVERLAAQLPVYISVDTSTPEVMRESAKAGAGLINDVRALQKEGAVQAVKETGLPICLMHMQGEPDSMQSDPQYRNVLEEVMAFLRARIRVCEAAGIAPQNIIIDPGFGFGKTLENNLTLLNQLQQFQQLKKPIMVGMSRKSMIAAVTGRSVDERLAGSLALATIAVERGADIIRVHDVKESVDAVAMATAVKREMI